MLPPDFFDKNLNAYMAQSYDLQEAITKDIVNSIIKTGKVTSTAAFRLKIYQEAGGLLDTVIARIAKHTGKSEKELRTLFKKAGVEALKWDDAIYTAAGLEPLPLAQSQRLLQALEAGFLKSSDVLQNLTLTTAASAQQAYIQACNEAYTMLLSGAYDINTVLRRAIERALHQCPRVLYSSGHSDMLDVALRRAVITGINQTVGALQDIRAEEMGSDLVEATAHHGARPSHAVWQGKVFSRSGAHPTYPPFSQTGYGTGPGLCGWNCRHSYFPFFEGLSENTYTREYLDSLKNRTVVYNGKEISEYDATQIQRRLERSVRESRRILSGYDTAIKGGADMKNEFNKESVKLKRREQALKDFCQQTGLGLQNQRLQSHGFNKSVSQKAVWANKKQLLPNYKQAVIPNEKIAGYSLNKEHLTGGRDKAIAFEQALGYNIDNAQELISNIKRNIGFYPAKIRDATKYGQPFEVKMRLTGPNGKTATVKTGWIIDKGAKIPRLTSAYVAKEKKKK